MTEPKATSVAIALTGHAYLPEAHAYARYLTAAGWRAECVPPGGEWRDADIAILFSARDQMRRADGSARRVHEYHSLSTGSLPHLRNRVKRLLTPRPAGRIFLNDYVEREYGFGSAVPAIRRPMGIDPEIFAVPAAADPPYDVVYCGSLERPGLMPVLADLATRGFRLIVFGNVPDGLDRPTGIDFAGSIARHELPHALAQARAGLNYTPDRYPYNVQTSTKTLEYAAAGRVILSNRYAWMEGFARERGLSVLWLDYLTSPDSLADFKPANVDLADLAWPTVLDASGFLPFLARIANAP